MKQFLVFVRKEMYHVSRDKRTLLIMFGLPVVQIILFGFALTNEVKNSSIVLVDYAKDDASQQLITKIEANHYFDIQKSSLTYEGIHEAFREGEIKCAVVFPHNFSD